MKNKDYDFAGWVTKNDIRCTDGVVIKHGAFKDNDQKKVPLVWNHNHNTPGNILGHIILHNRDEGVYGYGYFNESEEAKDAKTLIQHGDINHMSIGANKIKRQGTNVVHGRIYEVSLVLAGANPGALIEDVMQHSDDDEEVPTGKVIIYTDTLIHSADSIKEHIEPNGEDDLQMADKDKTIGDVLDTLSEEQMSAVEALLANVIDTDIQQSDDLEGDEDPQNNPDEEDDETMKHNVFNGAQPANDKGEVLTHSEIEAVFADAIKGSTLKTSMLEHGITNIEMLFPDATTVAGSPFIWRDRNTAAKQIVDSIHKSPFSRVKTIIADFTEDEARARGYIKGKEKIEQVFKLLKRETTPQTVYKKQKLDRDDIVDITDYNVVNFVNMEMKMMLTEELARAAMVGDGRLVSDESKIQDDKIRPIISDDDMYTIKKTTTGAASAIEDVIKAMAEYQGSGSPTLYASPAFVAELRLLKAQDGRFLFGDIPSKEAIATRLGVKAIVESTFFTDGFLLVNLADYTFGATKGGEITNFDDFDIDFNQYKYLIETRLSGALTIPKSAIYFRIAPEGTAPAVGE